jgi:predicted Zn-dependent peptidase
VARPRLLLALKDSPASGSGRARLRRELAAAVVLDCLFGNSGEVYLDLYERGLVDDNFSFNYSSDSSYAFALAGGETDDVPRLRRALDRHLDRLGREGIAAADFERVRNKELGGYARAFNAPDRIAQMLVGHHFRGTTIADYREVLFRLTRAEVNRTLRRLAAPERRCYSTVLPRK